MRICRIATIPFAVLHHLGGQIQKSIEEGHDVSLVTSPTKGKEKIANIPNAHYFPLNIPRNISVFLDVKALISLFILFRKNNFDLVHSITPKAGILTAIAAKLAGVPIRVHTFTGQRWVELSGPLKWIARYCDWLIVKLNTISYADSPSQRMFLIEQGIAAKDEIKVIASGSIGGVDLKKLDLSYWGPLKNTLRAKYGLNPDAKVIVFIGRLTKDKGIEELVTAFCEISRSEEFYLLLVGPLEQELDPLSENIVDEITTNKKILSTGYSTNPVEFLAIADLFCLPSYREGFGSVIIEAAAMGLPAVATRIVGLEDAVIHNETGILIPKKNTIALAEALKVMLLDDERRREMGISAKLRAEELFSEERVCNALMDEYNLLNSNSRA